MLLQGGRGDCGGGAVEGAVEGGSFGRWWVVVVGL